MALWVLIYFTQSRAMMDKYEDPASFQIATFFNLDYGISHLTLQSIVIESMSSERFLEGQEEPELGCRLS
jgi:hypothetical protein